MVTHRYRLPLALVVAAVAAGGATLLLRPRSGVVRPESASAGDYFTPQQLQRAHDFRAPQRTILVGSLLIEGAVLVSLVVRPPQAPRRLDRRPLLGAAAVGAGLSIGLTAV